MEPKRERIKLIGRDCKAGQRNWDLGANGGVCLITVWEFCESLGVKFERLVSQVVRYASMSGVWLICLRLQELGHPSPLPTMVGTST